MSGFAVAAASAAVPQPRNTDAIANPESFDAGAEGAHGSDDLMPGDNRQFGFGQFTIDDVQIGAAHATGRYRDLQLARAGHGVGLLHEFQRCPGLFENHCLHALFILDRVSSLLPVIPAVRANRMASSMFIWQGLTSAFGINRVNPPTM